MSTSNVIGGFAPATATGMAIAVASTERHARVRSRVGKDEIAWPRSSSSDARRPATLDPRPSCAEWPLPTSWPQLAGRRPGDPPAYTLICGVSKRSPAGVAPGTVEQPIFDVPAAGRQLSHCGAAAARSGVGVGAGVGPGLRRNWRQLGGPDFVVGCAAFSFLVSEPDADQVLPFRNRWSIRL